MEELTIALVQTDLTWQDAQVNLVTYEQMISEKVHDPVDIIFLPEMFNTGFSINLEKCAEEMDGPSIRFLKEVAGKRKCHIITSLLIHESDYYVNRQVTVSPEGTIQSSDKRHLFRLSEEFKNLRQGKSKMIENINGWNVLPLICYDLRFPVWSKNTFTDGNYGYDLLVYVSNWPASRAYVWKSLLVARAIENLSYVVGVNRIGYDGFGTSHLGDSMIVDPAGRIMTVAEPGKAAVCEARLSKTDLGNTRETYPFGQDWDQFNITP
jgi:omega-amidase